MSMRTRNMPAFFCKWSGHMHSTNFLRVPLCDLGLFVPPLHYGTQGVDLSGVAFLKHAARAAQTQRNNESRREAGKFACVAPRRAKLWRAAPRRGQNCPRRAATRQHTISFRLGFPVCLALRRKNNNIFLTLNQFITLLFFGGVLVRWARVVRPTVVSTSCVVVCVLGRP